MFPSVPPADAARTHDLDAFVEDFRRALDAFFRGDPGPAKSLFSRKDDVTLANPFGPTRRGWSEVEDALEQAAAHFRDGRVVAYEDVSRYVTPELGYFVSTERAEAKLGGREEVSPVSLRVTMIFRREDDGWKVAHRHADPITTARTVASLIQN